MALRAELAGIVGAANTLHAPADVARYLVDWSGDLTGAALAVVRPGSVAEVQAVMRFCAGHGLGVVPQGGNTGLAGGGFGNDPQRLVVLALERLSAVRALDAENASAVIEAGCTLQRAKEACAGAGLLFPLSTGAQGSSQIGGAAATNAGGINVLHYGMMRDLVLGLEVVLPDGALWQGLGGLRKDNRAIDLKQLFLGAEGTLGVITAVELRLFPLPERIETAYVATPGFPAAMALYRMARRQCAGLLTAFEVIGAECLAMARLARPDVAPPVAGQGGAHAILELSASAAVNARELLEQLLAEAMAQGLVEDGAIAQTGAQAQAMWAIREGLVEGQARRGFHLRTDLSVTLGRVPELVDRARALVAERWPGWVPQAYGHAGDGNVHFNVLPPEAMDAAAARAAAPELLAGLHALVGALGGSISAEHGIGRSRAAAFWAGVPAVQRRLLCGLKDALDPEGRMNPGCVFPPPPAPPPAPGDGADDGAGR